ncbi:FAD dependent oxidoreductase [Pleurostoma richardsiae]|uniref:FAD dependent oxidoreductase n=1 Tax=Pleurostoma richardsiae TaxID=41990 RepID=A0AA38VS89_9PEZI|nr:FAD dependent oxidoreductase [Pleurostoma richardsiae]
MQHHSRILILGGGTFGLSTAYHLAQAGYTNITILEKSASVPPSDSAGNDINKIVRAEYEDPFYSRLSLEAMEAWRKPPFAPYFRQVGCIWTYSDRATTASTNNLQRSLSTIQNHPMMKGQITPLQSRDDFRRTVPVFDGPMRWTGYLNAMAGYAHAADVLRALYSACLASGVRILSGDGVRELNYEGDRCVGVATQSGRQLRAELVIVALGASVVELLPQVRNQVIAKAWPIAHIQLSSKEAEKLRGIPITCAWDIGFLTEPDPRTNLMKLCPASGGYTNFDESGVSVPLEQNDFIPGREQARLRHLLRETLPALSERPFLKPKMCWCAETPDTNFVIDFVPGKRGLVVATGDSGHAFKFLPTVGIWVKSLIESEKQDVERWRWKEEQNAGGDAGWRLGETADLNNVEYEARQKL